jgi:hypothetical protein
MSEQNTGSLRAEIVENQPVAANPRVINASGTEQRQTAYEEVAEGTVQETDAGKFEFKKIVTGDFQGVPIEKIKPILQSNDSTSRIGEDFNVIDDWDNRKAIIDFLEGVHGKNSDNQPYRIAPGFLDVVEDYCYQRISIHDIPDHGQLREWMKDYLNKRRLSEFSLNFLMKPPVVEEPSGKKPAAKKG